METRRSAARRRVPRAIFLGVAWAAAAGCGRSPDPAPADPPPASIWPRLRYAGRDGEGVPNYIRRPFTAAEAGLLRAQLGVTNPHRLYLGDSSATAILRYDTRPDSGHDDMAPSFAVGFVSLRRPGESWEELRRRIHTLHAQDFPETARVPDTSLALLDPEVRPLFERMVREARARGFRIRVIETYRSPEREAYLMSRASGKTFTATSIHSYGRAVDVAVGRGDPGHPRTRGEYVAFRRWVLAFGRGRLKLIGSPDETWDWNHVEAPARWLGFHTIEEALAGAGKCAATPAPDGVCVFRPRLPRR
ncbi:MAG TPA: hypothetical protein VFQ38_00515 [Longimicrobiales bacterium]|nr:hypothetical protein [Longimicrobiales bacterium]